MKQFALFTLGLCTMAFFTACKSQESAYRKAFEKAQQQNQNRITQPTVIIPNQQAPKPVATPVVPVEDNDPTPVRTIQGGVTVVDGDVLKAYSVVVGSFINRTNADGMAATLRVRGLAARVVKTNETINGHTGWYRVIASSFDSKAQAVQSKSKLVDSYPGAWLLFHK